MVTNNHPRYSRFQNLLRSLSWRWLNWKHGFFFRRLRLEHTTQNGIRIPIRNLADWAIYKDIFASGEYDVAIRGALGAARGTCRILDLGANVGIFAKRLLHLRRVEYPRVNVDLICVEGLPATYRVLEAEFPRLMANESVRLIHGLAGKRDGSALLKADIFHAMTSLSNSGAGQGVKVSFVDLDELTSEWTEIDLLKCDVEGSEELVIRNYPTLLTRTIRAVFEFHYGCVDEAFCLKCLHSAQLAERYTIQQTDQNKVVVFER